MPPIPACAYHWIDASPCPKCVEEARDQRREDLAFHALTVFVVVGVPLLFTALVLFSR